MSYTNDPAEQVVRLSLEGAELAAKLTGAGAKQLAVLLCAIMRDTHKTKGKARLTSMLRSGKPLKVFAVRDGDLAVFCREAKKYGVLYCVLKDRDARDCITDVMVRAEDAAKINRIFERFELSTVDMASVRSEIEHGHEEKGNAAPEQDTDAFLDALFQTAEAKEKAENPTEGRTEEAPQSEPFSTLKGRDSQDIPETGKCSRPSVRQELKEIVAEQRNKAEDKLAPQSPAQHKSPPVKKKSQKVKER